MPPPSPTIDQVKREFSKARMLALAEEEQLATSKDQRFQCPLRCSDAERGCSVSDTDGYALWHCQRCDHGGSAIDLVIATRQLDLAGALAHLVERLPHLTTTAPAAPSKPAPPDPALLWRSLAATDQTGLAYLESRGLAGAATIGAVRFNAGGSGYRWLDHKAIDGYRVAMPLYDAEGRLATMQLRCIVPTEAKLSKISLPGAYPAEGVVFGAVGKARSASRVYLTEGMADTLALTIADSVVLGAPGTDQLKKLPAFLGDIVGRTVVLCPQNDQARVAAGARVRLTSEQAFYQLEQQLSAAGAEVLTLRTPAPHKDPAEWLKAIGPGAFREQLELLQSQPEEPTPQAQGSGALKLLTLPARDPRPRIIVRTDEHLVAEEAIKALAGDETIYQRDGMLVHVVRDAAKLQGIKREANAPRIAQLPPPVLRERLAAQARWVKVLKTKGKIVPEHPPAWAVNALHARGSWDGIRHLEAVVEAPVLRSDGTVLERPGYDDTTGLLYEPSGAFPSIPAAPSREEAASALMRLTDIVEDFPFAKPAHLSAWLAALLTPLVRHAFQGPAPLFLFDANTRGSGKSKLADLVSLIVSGRDMARMPAEDKDEEWRKRIMSVALSGDPMVLVDNVVGSLGSKALDAALTGTRFFDRMLGANTMATVSLKAVWYASGNNVQLRGDLIRRTLHVRLESAVEKPEERTDFKHPRLIAHVLAERPKLLAAALTVLRAYHHAGAPDQKLVQWGSYEEWSRLVRHPIVWLGLPDPWATREALAEAADPETALLGQLLSAWEAMAGTEAFSVRDVLRGFEKEEQLARLMKQPAAHPPLYDVFCELSPAVGGAFNVRSVANRLRGFRGRVLDGKYLDLVTNRKDVAQWRVRSTGAESAGSAGSAGSSDGHAYVNFLKGPVCGEQLKLERPQTEPAEPAEPAGPKPRSGEPSA